MTTLPVAEHILRLRPYLPGKPIEEVQRELGLTDIIKLASNENPLGPSPQAVAAITRAAASVTLYPEGSAPLLRQAVSRHVQMPPETLVFGNGSDEVLHLLALSFLRPGDEVVQGDPSFAMYEIYTIQCGATPVKVPLRDYTHDLEAMADAIGPKTRMVVIANPNNPTGTLVTRPEIERFLGRVPPDVLVVFDEAYDEYVSHPDKADLRPLVRDGRNVVILHTFSKAYGLAGLRVGYGMARTEIAEILNRVRSPFNVNLLAQAAAIAALDDQAHVARSVALNAEGRDYFCREFERLGLGYVPSQANFMLVDVGRDSRAVFDALLRRGVIVRAGAGLGLPRHIRVTVGTPDQNARFIAALEDVLA
ncbi:MAG: histidinol-phosphate transaminase [Armatimonadetes bacterium]|nr:histidinol-phosphate transaminase [Armatimonadota bacterium]